MNKQKRKADKQSKRQPKKRRITLKTIASIATIVSAIIGLFGFFGISNWNNENVLNISNKFGNISGNNNTQMNNVGGDGTINNINNGDNNSYAVYNDNSVTNNYFPQNDIEKAMFSTYNPVDIEFNSAYEFYNRSEYANAEREIAISLKNQEEVQTGLLTEEQKIAFYEHFIDVNVLYANIELMLSNPRAAEKYLMTAINTPNNTVEMDEIDKAFLNYELGVIYYELGQYSRAIEEANKVIESFVGPDYASDIRDTTLANSFILLGNCLYMQYAESSFNDHKLFEWAYNCYASAILTYQIPEIREEIKYFVFGAEIGKMTFENGAVITSPISMSALMSEHLLQDMSDEEKGTVISAYTNLSQLWSTVFTDLNSAQLYATIAIRIGENLPIGSKSILALAYANWFKATLFANTVSKPNEDYSEAARAEAEKKITEIKDIGVNFNWESPYYASALLYAGQYFGLLGDNERSLDLLLESEAAFIRREEFTVAQYLLPKLKESYKELHPVKTALGGFDRWFEGEVSRRIN